VGAYEVLGVGSGATSEEVRKKYRRLLMDHHPDRAAIHGLSREEAERKTIEIIRAFEDVRSGRAARGDPTVGPGAGRRTKTDFWAQYRERRTREWGDQFRTWWQSSTNWDPDHNKYVNVRTTGIRKVYFTAWFRRRVLDEIYVMRGTGHAVSDTLRAAFERPDIAGQFQATYLTAYDALVLYRMLTDRIIPTMTEFNGRKGTLKTARRIRRELWGWLTAT
jgi:hypothetical protein